MPVDPFPIIDASRWEIALDEPTGLDEKTWLVQPGTAIKWIYKPITVKLGHHHGEDWAEKIASELGKRLTVPCAEVEMATRDDTRGCLSRNLRPPNYDLYNGYTHLSIEIAGYQPGKLNVKGRPGHSLKNIKKALEGAGPPPNADLPTDFTAFDTFVGYLMLDAWIANRDRHDENWAILVPRSALEAGDSVLLCGSYDHAGSLGYNVTDDRRLRILREGRLGSWAEAGTAWRFEHDPASKPPTLVDLAARALDLAGRPAATYWTDRLASVTDATVEGIVARAAEMSDPARRFAMEVLKTNRGRLLRELS